LYDGFIIGAKSQAAKEYWYEQFKQDNIKVIEAIQDMS
jgi:hypothetical protein